MVTVEIERLQCKYQVSSVEKIPYQVRQRLDQVALSLLSSECDRIFSPIFSDDSPLVFIKSLKTRFSLSLGRLNDDNVASLWAERIASATRSAMLGSDARGNVIVFRNSSEYLASFIGDLLAGVAWQKWYYQQLKDLRKLDNRGIIIQLFNQNREETEDTLVLLTQRNDLNRLLKVLREEDVEALYEGCLDTRKKHSSRSYRELVSMLAEIHEKSRGYLQGEDSYCYKNFLSVYMMALQDHPELKSVASLKQAVKLTFLLTELAQRHQDTRFLEEPAERWGMEPGYQNLSALIKEAVNLEGRDALLKMAKAAIQRKHKICSKKMITSHGGVFMLIRVLLDNRFHLLTESAPFPQSVHLSKTRVFLLLLAQKIAGHKKFLFEGIDPGLLLFAGYTSHPAPGLIKDYIQSLTPEINRQFMESLSSAIPEHLNSLKEGLLKTDEFADFDAGMAVAARLVYHLFAKRLRRFDRSSPEYLFENFLRRTAQITVEEGLISIRLSPKPLDVVLRLSGLLEDINQVPWLDNRDVKFILGH